MILHTTRFVCVHSHFHLLYRKLLVSQTKVCQKVTEKRWFPKCPGSTENNVTIFNWLWIRHLYVAWCVKESRARQIPMNITIHILLTRNPGSEFNFIFSSFTFWMNDNFPFSCFFQMCPISRGNFCLLCSQYIRLPISLPRRKIGKI